MEDDNTRAVAPRPFRHHTSPHFVPWSPQAQSLLRTRDGQVWVATTCGVQVYREDNLPPNPDGRRVVALRTRNGDETVKTFTEDDGLGADAVRCLLKTVRGGYGRGQRARA